MLSTVERTLAPPPPLAALGAPVPVGSKRVVSQTAEPGPSSKRYAPDNGTVLEPYSETTESITDKTSVVSAASTESTSEHELGRSSPSTRHDDSKPVDEPKERYPGYLADLAIVRRPYPPGLRLDRDISTPEERAARERVNQSFFPGPDATEEEKKAFDDWWNEDFDQPEYTKEQIDKMLAEQDMQG